MKLKLNLIDPFDKNKPNLLQQQILSLDLSGKGIQFRHFVAGRGASKSTGIVLFLLQKCTQNKIVALYLSPTYTMIMDNFLPLWREIIPSELYIYKAAEKKIILVNGSEIWLRSRHADNPIKAHDALRGINASIIVDDEAAIKFDKKFFTTSIACLRRGTERAYISATTPKISGYSEMISGPGHVVYRYTTSNNKHLPQGFVESARQEMSDMEFKREILGEMVELGGKVFQTFSTTSNTIEYQYNDELPFIVSMDIGSATASCLIWQNPVINGKLRHVVVGEYHGKKSDDNSARRILEKISLDYGTPIKIIAGNDVVSRDSASGQSTVYIARQVFGGVPVISPDRKSSQTNKEIQWDCVNAMICSGNGNRNLLVSNQLKSYDPDGRGIFKMFQNYAWPESQKVNEIFPNDHKYEHVADALAYYTVCHGNKPKYLKTNYVS